MRNARRKLLVLSALLGLLLVVVHASPALALCYRCIVSTSPPCPEATYYSNGICCPTGQHPICQYQYDDLCIIGVTAIGCQ